MIQDRSSESLISSSSDSPIDITAILAQGLIIPHFQPLVSMRQRGIMGFEGLSRGWDTEKGALIPAPRLFAAAQEKGVMRELDVLCREKILSEFSGMLGENPELVISVNVEPSSAVVDREWKGYLERQVREAGLPPRNVIIEILESVVEDTPALLDFVERHRAAGFLIALDDVGSGHSNLNRVPLIRPDIIKVDRYLVDGVDKNLYKREVFKSLLSMAGHLGTVIIAEGAETEAEATTLLDMGVDLIQGFYFAKPQKRGDLNPGEIERRIGHTGVLYRERRLLQASLRHGSMSLYHRMIRDLVGELSHLEADRFESHLRTAARPGEPLECMYVLDGEGLQATEMVFNGPHKPLRDSAMFRVLPVGADHSLRDYYYFLRDDGFGKSTYVTEPHVSMATGNLCVTISARALDVRGRPYVLCLEVQAP